MSRPQGGRIQVPDDLREILLEFTISYLLEQPGDVIDYAVEFFTRLQNNRTTTIVRGPSAGTPDESIISDEEGIFSSISHRPPYPSTRNGVKGQLLGQLRAVAPPYCHAEPCVWTEYLMLHSYTQLHTKHVDLAQVATLDMNFNFLIYFSVALLIFQQPMQRFIC